MAQYLGDVVERKYEEGLKGVGSKLWSGVKQVASSGFGKGALIMAGVVLGGAALLVSTGILTITPMIAGHVAGHALPATIGTGLKFGVNFLTSIGGAAALVTGGAIGFAAQPKKISSGEAQALAVGYERRRQPELAQQLMQEMPTVANNVTENKWQMAELKRRAMRNTPSEGQAV